MIYEVPTGVDDLIIDIDTYSLLRDEPTIKGVDDEGGEYDLAPEQLAIAMEWFRKNEDRVYDDAYQSVSND